MSVATILGAGAMGSAFSHPLAIRGFEVRLWGTPLDDAIVAALGRGEPHPRTGARITSGVTPLTSDRLDEALDGCELLVIAVASVGFEAVLTAALDRLQRPPTALAILTKGFVASSEGQVELLTEAANRVLAMRGLAAPVIGIGGPCKANEVAAGRPTWSVLAGGDPTAVANLAGSISTPDYCTSTSTDVIGVEISAALKNLYATGLGMCDGLGGRTPWHNLRAMVLTEAVSEMGRVVEALGGRPDTALGPAGVGDLDVTGRSGRNRTFGERIGRGESSEIARSAMGELGLTVEGWMVASTARRLVLERAGESILAELPLLEVLVDLLTDGADPRDSKNLLVGAVRRGRDQRGARPGCGNEP